MNAVFLDSLAERDNASRQMGIEAQTVLADEIMLKTGCPRLGTSGAANAFLLLIGSEFGAVDTSDRPHYSERTMGKKAWNDLWRLRINEPNPHFHKEWESLRKTTTLWNRLYSWLPEAFRDNTDAPFDVAHKMFMWANLAITKGGSSTGTAAQYRLGISEHIVPLITEAHPRIVAATNAKTWTYLSEWVMSEVLVENRVAIDSKCTALLGNIGDQNIVFMKAGHPSRGVSRQDFTHRIRSALELCV